MASTSVLKRPAGAVARADAFARDPERLEVLRRTGLLDAGIQDSLQRFARLAAELTGAPISFVSLVDADRQYFSGAYGRDVQETPLGASYCKHAIADDVQLSIDDSHADEIFAHNDATQADVRAYLGSPFAAGGARLGALCVIDTETHAWGDEQRRIIHDLSIAVANDIELRLNADASARMAQTDALTGLGNRRALAAELARVFAERRSVFVGMLDLDGFKAYNDTFGHPAGDDLLVRISGRLRDMCGAEDELFRMGGDEFCMLTHERDRLIAAQRAVEDRGAGFVITSCLGIAHVPDDAADVTAAIGVADERMYAYKRARSASADTQVASVLLRALSEREGSLGAHSDNVYAIAHDTAVELGVKGDELRSTDLAARLHDIGKMAISDAILAKPIGLDAEELRQIKFHTLIGERILAAAPAMSLAAKLVRSSHERFDGDGYPDNLAGTMIPLGARIIYACDAFDAIISDRPYRRGNTTAQAIAELQHNSGTQFDPRVIAALLRVIARQEGRGTLSPAPSVAA
jgi:diguanylate cyclase (GGDEF)-like protein